MRRYLLAIALLLTSCGHATAEAPRCAEAVAAARWSRIFHEPETLRTMRAQDVIHCCGLDPSHHRDSRKDRP